jgi:hypothetical protein
MILSLPIFLSIPYTKKSVYNTLLKFFILNNKNCDLKAHFTIILTIEKGHLKTSYPDFSDGL